jgi:hypothetical protein
VEPALVAQDERSIGFVQSSVGRADPVHKRRASGTARGGLASGSSLPAERRQYKQVLMRYALDLGSKDVKSFAAVRRRRIR